MELSADLLAPPDLRRGDDVAQQGEELALTRILPAAGWQPVNVRELWQYRELLYFLVWRDVKVRYKQTVLGALWALIQPLLMMVVFTIFFSRLAGVDSGGMPYSVFAYLGLLPWTFFATAISNAGNSVVGSERLITKIYFPRLAVPFASVGASVVDFIIACSMVVVLMAWNHMRPGPAILVAPFIFLTIMIMALGIGTLLAALNVSYRDFRYVIPFLVQVWMFATPSVYMKVAKGNASHGALHAILSLNPLTGLITAFRAACSGGAVPWEEFAMSAATAAAVFLVGCLYFRRTERNFADII
jgi:lipopolysaccharide transport system permease protein